MTAADRRPSATRPPSCAGRSHFIFSCHSPETQADASEFPVRTNRTLASGPRTSPRPDLRIPPSPFPALPFSAKPAGRPSGLPRMREMKLQDLKSKSPAELLAFAEEHAGRERLDHAQAGADVRDPQAARRQGNRHHRRRRRRGAVRRLRLPALAGSELPARPGRHLRLALADPPLRPAHRRHRRGPDPLARRKASATSRCSRSTRSISRTPRRRATRSTSTT